MYTFCIFISDDGQVGCFHVLDFVTSSTVAMGMQDRLGMLASFLLEGVISLGRVV